MFGRKRVDSSEWVNPPFLRSGEGPARIPLAVLVGLFKQRAESIEAALPNGAVVRNPLLEGVKARWLNATGPDPACLFGVHQSALLKDLEMLRDGGERDSQAARRAPRRTADHASGGRALRGGWDRPMPETGERCPPLALGAALALDQALALPWRDRVVQYPSAICGRSSNPSLQSIHQFRCELVHQGAPSGF